MTTKEGQAAFGRYWGVVLACISAGVYGLSVWLEETPNKTGAMATIAGVVAVVKILADRNKQDTTASVGGVLTWQTMLAGLELQQRLDEVERHQEKRLKQVEQHQNERHAENNQKLDELVKRSNDNALQHAEHIAVTNSHAQAITALGDLAAEIKPGFTLPKLHPRTPPK